MASKTTLAGGPLPRVFICSEEEMHAIPHRNIGFSLVWSPLIQQDQILPRWKPVQPCFDLASGSQPSPARQHRSRRRPTALLLTREPWARAAGAWSLGRRSSSTGGTGGEAGASQTRARSSAPSLPPRPALRGAPRAVPVGSHRAGLRGTRCCWARERRVLDP